MYRNLLLSLVSIFATVSVVADNSIAFRWQSSLLPPADNKCQAIGYDIRANAEGNAFLLAQYGSVNTYDESTFLGQTLTGAEYGTGNSYNPNLVFTKVDSVGNPLWMIHSTEGNFLGGTYCPTRDGGAVLAVKFRLTEKKKQQGVENSFMTLQDATGKTCMLTATFQEINFHRIVLVRLNAQGAITTLVPLWTSQAVLANGNKPAADVADITAIMEDEQGNLYFQGGQAMDIALGSDTIYARQNADWNGNSFSENCNSFIIKTDARFRYLAQTTTTSTLLYERFMLSAYRNGKIFVVGHAKADSTDGTLQWGDRQADIRERCIVIARLDSNLICTHLNTIPQVRLGGLGGMFKQLAYSPDGTHLYMSGALIGGLVLNGDTLRGGNNEKGSFNDGLLLEIDANTATADNAMLTHGNLLNINVGTVFYNDTLYVLNYSFGDIHLACYDQQLHLVNTVSLATGGGSSVATGMASYGHNLWLGTRAHGGVDFAIGNETIVPASLWYATLSGWQFGDNMSSDVATPAIHSPQAQKILINSMLYIRRGTQLFNVLGQSTAE